LSRLLLSIASCSLTLLAFLSFAGPSYAVDRVALVIGNGAYQKVPALPNPSRDSTDIARSLERLGFQVTLMNNATASDMRKALVDFGRKSDGSDIALVFFAGHGMEVGGENWLIPIDAELRSDTDVESEAVSLRSVNLQVAKSRRLGLVILDACRNNPFASRMKRSLTTRAVERGLARTEPTDNVLVAYAARDGTTASDGTGRNSPFTAALLRNIETPGLEISFLFRRVRDDVMAATNREQQPFVYGSLSKEEIYLKPAPTGASEKVAKPPSPPEDEQFWAAIETSDVAGLFEEFVKRYPHSSRVAEAWKRIRSLSSPSTDSKVATAAPNPDPSPPKQRPFSSDDLAEVSSLASKLQLKLPSFSIAAIKDDVPRALRRFVGIWANKNGYEGGGRKAMLIVTDVTADGTVTGQYLWGPPGKHYWVPDPAGSTAFRGTISQGALEFQLGNQTTMNVRLEGQRMIVRPRMQTGKEQKTSLGYFSPVWRLESN
jgi:uncharacterized caspase-like protein